ncbi:hypothetical protein GCM10027445_16700 [Amycolatopsis endophytica]
MTISNASTDRPAPVVMRRKARSAREGASAIGRTGGGSPDFGMARVTERVSRSRGRETWTIREGPTAHR